MNSTKQPSPSQVKRALHRAGLTQARGAALIGKSTAMVSLVLNKKAKSAPVLRALFDAAQKVSIGSSDSLSPRQAKSRKPLHTFSQPTGPIHRLAQAGELLHGSSR